MRLLSSVAWTNKMTLLGTWTRDHTSYELVSFFMVARDVNFPRPDINFPFSETRAVCSRHSLRWDQSQSSADTEHSQQWWSSPAWHWSSPPPPSPVSPPPGQGWPAWVWWCCQPVTPSDAGLTTKEYHSRMNLMSYQSSRYKSRKLFLIKKFMWNPGFSCFKQLHLSFFCIDTNHFQQFFFNINLNLSYWICKFS